MEVEGTSTPVSGDISCSVETTMSSPVLLGGQVVMENNGMMMEGSEDVVMDGTQVVMEAPQVVSSQVMIEGSQVMMEEGDGTEFGASVLNPPHHGTVTEAIGDPVSVKEEDLENGQYAHNQPILSLEQPNVHEDVMGTGTLEDNQEGEILLRNLVNETFHSSASATHPHDNIIVTTSTITTDPMHTIQQPLQQANMITGSDTTSMTDISNSIPPATTPTKIVIQTNQGSPVKSNAGHFLIQVGGNPVAVSQPQVVTVGNKKHIIIRAGANQMAQQVIPSQEEVEAAAQSGVFRVIIPEGTTKYTKGLTVPVGQNEPVRKHVQINLSDGTLKKQSRYMTHTSQTQGNYEEDFASGSDAKRFYECPTCNSKFMRPLYLRKHMRSCKKEEVKVEKAPLYMCSFCKMTFKTKPQISQHFLKCFHSPYGKKGSAVKRKNDEKEAEPTPAKRGKVETVDLDPSLEQAVQFRCQDCDRTFNKERQYSSHIKKCTKVSVHDLSGARQEIGGAEEEEEEPEPQEDPFADPDPLPAPARRGRGPGRRGRPPGRGSHTASRAGARNSAQLFDGTPPVPASKGLLVADNEGLVRSTTGLAHTVQLSLETASQEGEPQPTALVADSKGVRGREKPPQAWSLVCALCQKMFITKAALAHHVMTEHGPDLEHMRNILDGKSTDSQPLFRCPVCSLNYQTEDQFIEHMVLQHTTRLQETYTRLQGQTANFVCSLCSLVLLTKNLLVEHMSLVHLEELEKLAQGDTHVEMLSKASSSQAAPTKDSQSQSSLPQQEGQSLKETVQEPIKAEQPEEPLECGFCGEEISNQVDMVEHYIESHGVETDEDGCLMDLGIDVDVRVKDTKSLLQLADGRVDDNVPEKTVLIRKKPRQSWQCKECQQVFPKHFDFLRHVREVCTEVSQSNKSTVSRGGNFKCQEPGCSHLSFYQVKLLFKHMEEVHKVVVPREFKTFKSLAMFYQWLTLEEKKYNVRYIRDTTRIEKNDVKLIQMVCHRFHTAKIDQSREKKEGEVEGESPSKLKRRWFVRIQRSSNCHARIHLKVHYNPVTQDYDAETQMVYYPQHTHNEVDHPQDIMNRIMERHSRDKSNYLSRNGNRKRLKQIVQTSTSSEALGKVRTSAVGEGDERHQREDEVEGQPVMIPGSLKLEEGGTLTVDQYMKEFCQTQLEGEVEGSTGMAVSAASSASGTSSTSMQAGRQPGTTTSVLMEGHGTSLGTPSMFVDGTNEGGSAVLVESGEPGTYVVQDGMMMNVSQGESPQKEDGTEEYVLPADEAEWTKLFEVLRLRLMTAELSSQEKVEGEGLLTYQNVISYLPLSEQVTIFQQLCLLTNTAIETAD